MKIEWEVDGIVTMVFKETWEEVYGNLINRGEEVVLMDAWMLKFVEIYFGKN